MENKVIKLSGYNTININTLKTLNLFYAPLLKYDAIALYTTLMSLFEFTYTNYEELSMILQKSMQEIEINRTLLEEYKLIRTFVDKDEKLLYIDIQKPLDEVAIMTHKLYSRLLFNKLEESFFVKLKSKLPQVDNFNHLIEISKNINLIDEMDELILEEDKYQSIVEFGIEHNFDYATFIKKSDPFGIPLEFIENKNILNKIGEYASIYDIDAVNMAKIVAKCTILATKTLDFDKLQQMASKAKIVQRATHDGVMHPLQFIKSKQQGIEPKSSDKKLVEKLIIEYRLSYELINLLLEYSLNKNEGRLVGNYVETIALSWIRKNVKTPEEARLSLEQRQRKTTKKDIMIESWNEKDDEKVEISLDEFLKKG